MLRLGLMTSLSKKCCQCFPKAVKGLLPGRDPLHIDLVLQCQQEQVSTFDQISRVMYDAQRGQLSTAPSSAWVKFGTCTDQAAAAGDRTWPDYSSDSALEKGFAVWDN